MNIRSETHNETAPRYNQLGWFALAGAMAAGAGAAIAYKYYFQPWEHRWGATDEDLARVMPGDILIEDADVVTTCAITIDAPPESIFPWLVQMGQGRGGAYTYDWIERLLGLNMHSADRVVPELQFLEVGDFLPLGSDGGGFVVKVLDSNRALALEHTDGTWTWEFGLYPDDNGNTRLVSRNRISTREAGLGMRLYLKMIDPGAFVMERKMLLGIKERAERNNELPAPHELADRLPIAIH